MADIERKLILRALQTSGDNKAEAARLLGISERTLWCKLKREVSYYRSRSASGAGIDDVLGKSRIMEDLRSNIRRLRSVPVSAAPIIRLTGETGVGKGLVARAVPHNGPRAARPFIEVNCAALPFGLAFRPLPAIVLKAEPRPLRVGSNDALSAAPKATTRILALAECASARFECLGIRRPSARSPILVATARSTQLPAGCRLGTRNVLHASSARRGRSYPARCACGWSAAWHIVCSGPTYMSDRSSRAARRFAMLLIPIRTSVALSVARARLWLRRRAVFEKNRTSHQQATPARRREHRRASHR